MTSLPVTLPVHSQLSFLMQRLQLPQKLLAFENFYFILEGLGKQPLPADVTTGDYKVLGSQYCKLSMPLDPGSHAAQLSDSERYCFGSAFASPLFSLNNPLSRQFIYPYFQVHIRGVERLSRIRLDAAARHPPNIRIIHRLDSRVLDRELICGYSAFQG
jgi:hypothetical protein